MYTEQRVHVPSRYHQRIKAAVTQDNPLSVKVDLKTPGEDTILITSGQLIKINRALKAGKNVLTLRFSRKQVRANLQYEGGFLGTILSMATKFLPQLLGGLATGALSGAVEKAVSGSGLFLGRRGMGTAKIDFTEGKGLVMTPVEQDKYNGLYVKDGDEIYQGKGLLLGPNSPFKNFPLLNLIL